MKILVATPLQLLLVDTATWSVAIVEANRSEYYGISWLPDGEKLCLAHSGIDHALVNSMEDYMDSEVGWISLGDRASTSILSAPHQILCLPEHVITVNTGRNCLTVFNTDDLFYRHVWLDKARWDRKGNSYCGQHLNSVAFGNDQLYVLAHNWNLGSELFRVSWPDLRVVERQRTAAYQAHNIWLRGSEIIVCDTFTGAVMELNSQRKLWQAHEHNALTRGLASDGQYVFVGSSMITPDRQLRSTNDGGIWVLDAQTWQELDYIHLPGTGVIHEIRILDRPDLCHHKHCFRGSLPIDAAATAEFLAKAGRQREWMSSFLESSGGETATVRSTHWVAQVGEFFLAGSQMVTKELALATLRGVRMKDVVVRARFDVGKAGIQHAGVVARYRGPHDTNMVLGMVHNNRGGYSGQIWHHVDGGWALLAERPVTHGAGIIELKACAGQLTLTVNDQIVATAETTILDEGAVGIRSLRGGFGAFSFQPVTDGQSAQEGAGGAAAGSCS